MAREHQWMAERYEELVAGGLNWDPPTLESASEPECTVDGQQMIMLSANNYLNLTTHPKVVAAMIEATQKYGAGSGSVRAISGTMDIHLQAEEAVAKFKGVEASLIYSAGYTANVGLIPTLVQGKQDVIISDELNHGSIIDGVRLTKAQREVYPHNDMDGLEQALKNHSGADRKLIITDGVFSMDGDICPLDEITELAEAHDAMVMVDDCHGEGVMGSRGAGIVDHFSLQGRVDFEVGSFSKALGVQGGILAGSAQMRLHALNHSRSWLLSGSQPQHHQRLLENTRKFRTEMASLGFDLGVSTTPIIPVMCGESRVAKDLVVALRDQGIVAGAIVFPMVARDAARVRNQLSAGLTDAQLDSVLRGYEMAGRKVGLI